MPKKEFRGWGYGRSAYDIGRKFLLSKFRNEQIEFFLDPYHYLWSRKQEGELAYYTLWKINTNPRVKLHVVVLSSDSGKIQFHYAVEGNDTYPCKVKDCVYLCACSIKATRDKVAKRYLPLDVWRADAFSHYYVRLEAMTAEDGTLFYRLNRRPILMCLKKYDSLPITRDVKHIFNLDRVKDWLKTLLTETEYKKTMSFDKKKKELGEQKFNEWMASIDRGLLGRPNKIAREYPCDVCGRPFIARTARVQRQVENGALPCICSKRCAESIGI